MNTRRPGSRRLGLWGIILLLPLASCHLSHQLQLNIDVSERQGAQAVPPGFLGLSMEPQSAAGYIAAEPVFQQLIKNLAEPWNAGPLNIRWGGNAQDIETDVFPDEVWQSMTALYFAVGEQVVQTIALNLPSRNLTLATEQIRRASKILPPGAISGISVGNEPDSYMYRKVGYKDYMQREDEQSYFADQLSYMRALAPILKDWLGTAQVFQGPAVSNPKDFPTSLIAPWVELGKEDPLGPYTKTLSLHYYTESSRSEKRGTVDYILTEGESVFIRNTVGRYAPRMRRENRYFRLDETNTLSSQGKPNVSDTLAAALWMIDISLNIMQVEAHGINFHTFGCAPYSPILMPGVCGSTVHKQESTKFRDTCAATCGQKNAPAIVNAPYYGLLLIQEALSNAADKLTLLGTPSIHTSGRSFVKPYVLVNGTEARVVLINKGSQGQGTTVTLSLRGDSWGMAQVTQLLGHPETRLATKTGGITWGGQRVNDSGHLEGTRVTQQVEPILKDSNECFYEIFLPPASAALVVIQDQEALDGVVVERQKKGDNGFRLEEPALDRQVLFSKRRRDMKRHEWRRHSARQTIRR